jgi:hypothetical protein
MPPLPRDVHNALAKAQRDLEWAVRMFHESATPEAVNVPRLVASIEAALLTAKASRCSVPVELEGRPDQV